MRLWYLFRSQIANEFVKISTAIRTAIPAAASPTWKAGCGWETQ